MKHIVVFLLFLTPGISVYAADTSTDSPTPQELANQVITEFQTGRANEVKANLPSELPILEKGAKAFPSDPLIHFALALCFIAQGNMAAVIANMDVAYNHSNKNLSMGLMYAFAFKMDKQPLKAYELNKELLALHPDVPQVQVSMASLDTTIQKYDEAMNILEALIQNAPPNLDADDKGALYFMLGMCFLYKGEHDKAIESLENAQIIRPNMAMVLTLLGEAYLKNGNLDKAGENLDKALAINPDIPSALYYQGIYYEKTGNVAMAQTDFENAYTYGKQRLQDNGEDYYLMYLICQKLSKDDEGKTYKSEAEQLLFTYEAP